MIQDLIRLISENLTLIQLRHALIFFIIVLYAFIVKWLGVTSFKSPLNVTLRKIFLIIGKSVLVAVVEEFVFRLLLFYVVFQRVLHLNFEHAMIFTCLFFALGHFHWIGVHRNAFHKVDLFTGLFIFGMILCKNFPVGNIVFHMFAIMGVEVTSLIFKKEDPPHWWVWDESHALIRSPIVWILLIAYYFVV
jgi:hypothetical protein